MYQTSAAFHEAVANNQPQLAMIIFEDAVFTNSDIDVSAGLSFTDTFNHEEDLSIGQTPSNEISFSLFNDGGRLNNYEFGEFCALLGVRILSEPVSMRTTVYASTGTNVYTGAMTAPRLKRNGVALTVQPEKPVKNILIYNGIVHCFLMDGGYIAYNDSDGSVNNFTMKDFMKAKFQKLEFCGFYYNPGTKLLDIWQGEFHDRYEFVPLGYFTADRPNVPDVIEISFTCYDRMQKFEEDMPGDSDLGSAYINSYGGNYNYPISFAKLLKAMCAYANVPCSPDEFINSSATFSSRPDEFGSVSMRDVLKWIAEAACGNARFDRDGVLKIDWLHDDGQSLDETGYSQFGPYWYSTQKVTKLENRGTDGQYNQTTGTGDQAYLIQDNPLLRGVGGA